MPNPEQIPPTKRRILDAALGLFNERGATEVTTHHIAAACGMSPGNLYYHYQNKEEIIRALFADSLRENAVFQEETRKDSLDADEFKRRSLAFAQELSWRYRFFKRELPALLQRDPALAKSFRAFHRQHLADTRRDLEQGMRDGKFAQMTEQEVAWLAEISWLMVLFWPSFVEVGGSRSTRKEMDRGIEMIGWLFGRFSAKDDGEK